MMMWFKVHSDQKESFLRQLHSQQIETRSFSSGEMVLVHAPMMQQPSEQYGNELLETKKAYVLADRTIQPHHTRRMIAGLPFGQGAFQCIAGPCAVESFQQLAAVAETLVATKTPFIRAGAFKPRTSPYAFQGLGLEGLKLLEQVKQEYDLKVVTELLDVRDIETVYRYADIIQIGSRNMHHMPLLKAVGELDKPILLKRGLAATYEEFILAAEYILYEGNADVILCERGIRAFNDETRNVLDLAGVALLKQRTHLPVIVDPSHATGLAELVAPMANAALVAGADGVMVEVHPIPQRSVSDARQALSCEAYANMVTQLQQYARVTDCMVNKEATC